MVLFCAARKSVRVAVAVTLAAASAIAVGSAGGVAAADPVRSSDLLKLPSTAARWQTDMTTGSPTRRAAALQQKPGPVELPDGEIPSLRTQSSSTFTVGDGSLRTVFSTVPTHFLRDGAWVDVDDTLVRAADGTWMPTADSTSVSLPATAAGVMTAQSGKLVLSMTPADGVAAVQPDVQGATATYS